MAGYSFFFVYRHENMRDAHLLRIRRIYRLRGMSEGR